MVPRKDRGSFEKYIIEESLFSPAEVDALNELRQALMDRGIAKSIEEVALLSGLLGPEEMGAILDGARKKRNLAIQRPEVAAVSPEKDRALQEEHVRKGARETAQVMECRKLREEILALGLDLPASEILKAKGYLAGASGPVKPAAGRPPAGFTERPPSTRRKAGEARTPGTTRRSRAEAPPKKNRKLVLGLSIGGIAAVLLVAILIATSTTRRPPPASAGTAAPETTKVERVTLGTAGSGPVPVYSETELLQLHAGREVQPAHPLPRGTAVTLHGQLLTDRGFFCLVKDPSGRACWVLRSHLNANFDISDKRLEDYRSEWSAKVEAMKTLAAAAPPRTPEPAAAPDPPRTETPKPEPPPPAPIPEAPKAPVPAPAPAEKPSVAGYWKFDEFEGGVLDISGTGNDGKLMGGTAHVAGRTGRALLFDGTDDYVSCGVRGMPSANEPQTILFWHSVGPVATAAQPIVSLTNDAAASGVQVGYREGKVTAWKHGGKVLVSADPAARLAPAAPWRHIAYTFDGRTHRLYLDGRQADSSTEPPTGAAPNRLELGRWAGKAGSEYYKGRLDDVQILNRALGPDEVLEMVPAAPAAAAPSPRTPQAPAPPVPGPRPPADPGGPSTAAGREAREKKAQALWELAEQLANEGRFLDAQQKFRELRTRYRSTSFYFDKMELISDRINALGLRVAVGALQKTAPYRKTHQDSWFGYEFAPPDGWKGVPPMSLWFGEMDNDETWIKGRVERVARYTAPYLNKLYMSVYKVYACGSAEALEGKVTAFLDERLYKGLKEGARQACPGRPPGVRKTYTTPDGDRLVIYYFYQDNRHALALVGAWRSGGEEDFSITITTIGPDGSTTIRKSSSDKPVEEADFAHALKIFDQCARTFWIYDQGTRQGKTVLLNRSALCSDWNVMKSPRGSYLIEYGTSAEYAKRCAEELEQIFALYRQVIPTQKGIPQCRVRIFDREDDFMYYSGHPGAAAYWSPGHEEIVCYKFEGDKMKLDSKEEITIEETRPPEEVTFKVLYHECFHQYMYYLMGRDRGVDVPPWLGEGLGDYFFGGEWQKNPRKFQIGINEWRIKRIQDAVKKGQHVGLDKIVRYDQMAYYSNPTQCYAQGWAIAYFLLTSPVARAKGWSAIPAAMIDTLKSSGDAEKATNRIFQGVDLKAMEEEWKKFVLEIPLPRHLQEKPGE